LECSPPCHGGGRGFKSGLDRFFYERPASGVVGGLSRVSGRGCLTEFPRPGPVRRLPAGVRRPRGIPPPYPSSVNGPVTGGLTASHSVGTSETRAPGPGGGAWRRRLGTRRARYSAPTCRPPPRTAISRGTAPSATNSSAWPWNPAQAPRTAPRERRRAKARPRPEPHRAAPNRAEPNRTAPSRPESAAPLPQLSPLIPRMLLRQQGARHVTGVTA
jgi:hypothetical protein